MVDNYHLLSLDLSPPRPPLPRALPSPGSPASTQSPWAQGLLIVLLHSPPMPIYWQYTGHVTLRYVFGGRKAPNK